jgi:hypothetical protein
MAYAAIVSLSSIGVSLAGPDSGSPDLGGYDGSGQSSQQQQPPSWQQQQQPEPQQQSSPSPLPSPGPSPTPSSSPSSGAARRTLYLANLLSVDGSDVSGRVGVVVDGGSVGFSLQASGLAPGQLHSQYLSSGTCSDNSGSLDSGQSATQSSPNFQLTLPTGAFPLSSRYGNLTYIQSFSESSVASALPSGNSTGNSSSAENGGIDLNGKIVVILNQQMVPLACGNLYRTPE